MKTITLSQASQALCCCAAVFWSKAKRGQVLLAIPVLDGLTGYADNEFLYLSGTDDAGEQFRVKFTEGLNQTIPVIPEDGATMVLVDTGGEDVRVTLLDGSPLLISRTTESQ